MSPRTALPLLSLTVACAAGQPAERSPAPAPPASASSARAELVALRARHDRLPPGPARDALARRIDELAGQRYATWSGLYWHRDLGQAVAEARATGKPILSLRMLGRLDRDLSCANSRFFRVALYANAQVSRFLADHFVLHWSSERPVPIARIDFGDGRVLERTLAGNSAHYVLDAQGRPVDVLPGLYSPALFLDALARSEPVARRAAALRGPARADLITAFHRRESARAGSLAAGLGSAAPSASGASLMEAEMVAPSKARVETPVVESLQLGPPPTLDELQAWRRDSARWAELGAALAARVGPARLDDASRALVAALQPTDWSRAGGPISAAALDRLVASFEALMTRDSAYNELVLHQEIHRRLADPSEQTDFASLNRWVYATLFLTPAEDPWLGMATPDAWTALPGDGVAIAGASR
jgi:hypothetical protein